MQEEIKQELHKLCKNLHSTAENLRNFPVEIVFGLTADAESRKVLWDSQEILKILVIIVQNVSLPPSHCKNAALALVNISGDEAGAEAILNLSNVLNQQHAYNTNIVQVCIKSILEKSSPLADECCMILSNITRVHDLVNRVVSYIEENIDNWNAIISAFVSRGYNTQNAELHHLASVINNLSQSSCVRRYLMDRERCVIQRLFHCTQSSNEIRQRGIVGTLRNCTFDMENHEWLLSPNINLLPYLLLPLAGPEEFEDEDVDKLPLELQYLPATKRRDPNPEIRLMLLETLNQLCATKVGRQILREKNTYVILREFHKWEKNKKCLLACENIIDILIRTEEEIGVDNLKEVEVPSECTEKFHKMDQDFINDT